MAASPPFFDAVVVMGVAGCGKTTIGEALARALNIPFIEGDQLHSVANIAKMSSGIPLTDSDRWPWLACVGEALQGQNAKVASCSALKKSYREAIARAAAKPVLFVHLHGDVDILQQRMNARAGHFMPPALLKSQLATLEIPDQSENAVTINIDQSLEAITGQALAFVLKEAPKI